MFWSTGMIFASLFNPPLISCQEIHNKITSIGFQDCKVFIHSVDAQASASGGIIIQVIGEMSNHGDPWRKFVQTFFLAEQPNGYFVLNDIFRFLKEETADSEEGDPESESAPAPVHEPVPAASPVPVPAPETVPETAREPSPPPPPAVAAPTPVAAAPEEPPTTDVPETPTIIQTPTPAPEPPAPAVDQPNGIHTPEPDTLAPAPAAEESPVPEPTPLPAAPASAAATPPPPTTASPSAAAPSPAPAPSPSGPRSWASLAATNSKKWGSAVAQESRGVTETPVTPVSSGTQTPPSGGPGSRGPPHHHHHQHHHQHQHGPGSTPHPAYLAAQSITVPQCFIKVRFLSFNSIKN